MSMSLSLPKRIRRKMSLMLPSNQMIRVISSPLPTTPENYAQIKGCGLRWKKTVGMSCNCGSLRQMECEISVQSDHQPLETIFKKPLHAASRSLQKMTKRLQRYHIRVTNQKGTSLSLADRRPRATLPTDDDSKQIVFRLVIDSLLPNPRITSQTLEDIKCPTSQDHNLSELNKIIIHGWPSTKSQLARELHP